MVQRTPFKVTFVVCDSLDHSERCAASPTSLPSDPFDRATGFDPRGPFSFTSDALNCVRWKKDLWFVDFCGDRVQFGCNRGSSEDSPRVQSAV